MVEGCAVVRDMEVATFAVASLGDDEVDSVLDVGVIAMNWGSNVAIGDGGGEVSSKAPFIRETP